MPFVILLIVISMIVPWTASGQQAPPPLSPAQQEAMDAWTRRDWPRAAQAFKAVIAADSTQALAHLRLGTALTALKQYSEAKKHLAIAERRSAPAGQVYFRMALAEAGAGRLDSAFAQLKRATDAGLPMVPVPGDSLAELAIVKRDARFAEFTKNMDRNLRPCMYDTKYNELDFWLGTWDVRPRGQPGAPAGRNVITKVNDGCVVHESWNARASVGQSFNIYDYTRQKWFQSWVDNGGGFHEYNGTIADNVLRYEGTMPAGGPTAGRVKFRVTLSKLGPDSLRQLGETGNADGTWTTSYDLMYTRASGN